MSVAILPGNIELEETGDDIYDGITNPLSKERGDAVYENVDKPASQEREPPETLQSGKI